MFYCLYRFTSEDNASFEELTDLMVKKERVRNAWIYDNAEKHNKEKVVLGHKLSIFEIQDTLKCIGY